MLTADQFAGRDDGLLQQRRQDSHVCRKAWFVEDTKIEVDSPRGPVCLFRLSINAVMTSIN